MSRPYTIHWNYCMDPNEINEAINGNNPDWGGLRSASQIISITYDSNHGKYVVFWKEPCMKEDLIWRI